MKYNFSASSSLDAIKKCQKIFKNKDRYLIDDVYNTGRIIVVVFDSLINDSAIIFLSKVLKKS